MIWASCNYHLMKNENLTNWDNSDFTWNSLPMSHFELLSSKFSAVLNLLPETMTIGFRDLLNLKTSAFICSGLSVCVLCFCLFDWDQLWLLWQYLCNNTAELSGLRVQPWADPHKRQPARLDLALAMGN